MDTITQPVTRKEVAAALAGAFKCPPVATSKLRRIASENGARRELLETLDAVPPREFSDLRQIWPFLERLPVS